MTSDPMRLLPQLLLTLIAGILLTAASPAGGLKQLIDEARRSESPAKWRAAIDSARSSGDSATTALALISYAQALQNMEASPAIEPELRDIVDELAGMGCHDYAFAAENVLVDRLFADRRFDAADHEAEAMFDRAAGLRHGLGMAMALRVQGQIAYKTQAYDKAADILLDARSKSPDYRDGLNEFTTSASIDEWLWMSAVMTGNDSILRVAAQRYDEAVGHWITNGWDDPTGHFRVTAAAMTALAENRSGRQEEAMSRLDSARLLIKRELPVRAYEQYYLAQALVSASARDYGRAIACADTLIEAHRGYYPFYLADILLKAHFLNDEGRHEESVALYREYIHASDSVTRADAGQRLDELRVVHGVETAKLETERKSLQLAVVAVVALLIAAVLAVTLVYIRALRRKNRIMVKRLEEYDRKQPASCDNAGSPGGDSSVTARLDRHMTEERPFRNPALSRRELADAVGVKEQLLTAILREELGVSVMEYIAIKRLEEARHLIAAEPAMSLTDIAVELGFGTIRTFQRAFRKRYGMSPSEYRRGLGREGQ